ncbi:MAG: STAS domain-containing protein [Fibrobacterota bacterium]
MAVEQKEYGTFSLIILDGSLTVKEITEVKQAVLSAASLGHTKIAVDMSKSKTIDSSGVGLLANASKKMNSEGGSFAVVGVNEDILDIINIALPVGDLEIFSDIEELEKKFD